MARQGVTGMIKSIYLNSGTPQEITTWSNPDHWIDDLPTGDEQALARELWRTSGGSLNPRYAKGIHLFLNKHKLLSSGDNGVYAVTEKGNAFLREDTAVVQLIDYEEGMIHLLNMLIRDEFVHHQLLLQRWERFCLTHTELQITIFRREYTSASH